MAAIMITRIVVMVRPRGFGASRVSLLAAMTLSNQAAWGTGRGALARRAMFSGVLPSGTEAPVGAIIP
jgi:hypothetical protein